MKSYSLAMIGLLLASASPAPAQTASPAGVAAAESPRAQTNVWFTVFDGSGQCVGGLRAEDVRVAEDGAPQQITSFTARRDARRSIVVAIDNSMSQENLLPSVKRVAQALIGALARPGKDYVAVLSFADEAILEQDFTGDAARAQSAVGRILRAHPEVPYVIAGPPDKHTKPPGSTALQDALWLIGGEVFTSTPADERRVVVLLTDGRDTGSETKKRESLERLLGANVVVYAIGVGDERNYMGIDKGALKELAERTGGRAYFPLKDPEVRAVFAEIERSLSCQNFLSYAPANAGAKKNFRKLKIEIVNPELRKQGLRVKHREGYVFGQVASPPRGK
ncbi:MAG: VWA domain-containing protein [Acidobacteria bacterium]|nr:VWA domain-containing protein [Acidobacteriota bacterium]